MFLGRFEHTIDDKGRLTIPAKYRASLSDGVVVTRGLDRCVYIYPQTEWEQLAERTRKLPLTKIDARSLVRFLFSGASDCIPDRQGRVPIPSYLREYADLHDRVIVAGSQNHLEVWSPESWEQENSKLEHEPGAFAEKLGDLGIL
jgi:MraZ protein